MLSMCKKDHSSSYFSLYSSPFLTKYQSHPPMGLFTSIIPPPPPHFVKSSPPPLLRTNFSYSTCPPLFFPFLSVQACPFLALPYLSLKTTGRVGTMKQHSNGNHSVPSSTCISFQSMQVAPAVKEAVCHWHVVAQSASICQLGGSKLVSIRFFYPSSGIKSVS